jgi:hypothetical protein
MRLTILVDRGASPRSGAEYEPLAAELGARLQIEVPVVEAPLADAPRDGIVLVDPWGELGPRLATCVDELRAGLPARTLLLGPVGDDVEPTVESLGLGGAVPYRALFLWRNVPGSGTNLFGLRAVADEIGASIIAPRDTYCWFGSEAPLPDLLARYLVALNESAAG